MCTIEIHTDCLGCSKLMFTFHMPCVHPGPQRSRVGEKPDEKWCFDGSFTPGTNRICQVADAGAQRQLNTGWLVYFGAVPVMGQHHG